MNDGWFSKRRFMREHKWTNAQLSGYLDQELSADANARVHDHVGKCPECQRVLASLKKTLAAIRGLGRRPSTTLADKVILRLHEEW